jgi:hypothetical protein
VSAECSMGHCCAGNYGDMPPFTWCAACSCCFAFGILCNAADCPYGCIGT